MASTTEQLVSSFKDLQRKLWQKRYLMSILDYDGETAAPEKGAAARAEAMGALAGEQHELLTGPAAVELVAALEEAAAAGELDEQTATELRVLARDQREARAIPTEEEVAWSRLTSEANAVWHRAKLADDWASFEPYVTRIVETLKRRAALLDPTRDAYDVCLDQYERGMSAESYDAFFAQVREAVVPLVQEISQRPEPAYAFRSARVGHDAQLAIARDLLELEGLDMAGTSLGEVEHPFSDGFAPGDARVTTHIYETDALSNVFSILHEGGHAIYEQNIDPAYGYGILGSGTSMGIHESQSRFFENIVGRSRAFAGPLLAVLRRHAPDVYGGVSEDDLYRAANIASPQLIRMEADELTYPLHIMIRYDIERALFAGEATAADIPGLWRELTQRYLGIEVPSDTLGCLQDTHWSGGDFGYFPSYALGSAYGAQYVAAMARDGVDVDAACAAGDLAPVRAWLGSRIWRWGRGKDAPELIEAACGAPFDATYYCDYLVRKFTELYGL